MKWFSLFIILFCAFGLIGITFWGLQIDRIIRQIEREKGGNE